MSKCMPRRTIPEALDTHPRLVGALFAATLLLMNVGNVIAGGAGGSSGP